MQIGLIGLEETGFNLALSLHSKGYKVVVYDHNEDVLQDIHRKGISTTKSLKDFAESLSTKRVIWMMISAGDRMDETLANLSGYLSVSDIIIDGSNSFYKDTIRRGQALQGMQIDYLDCGVIGDIHRTASDVRITIGGNRFALNFCESLFKDIAAHGGYLYCGRSGSGHFASMIYKAVKDGTMQNLEEGLSGAHTSEFTLDIEKIINFWKHNSISEN
ncbi:NAD(P)-binding domain-containing protein [Ohtaekwangia koreensis]|uniref:6-phosphogluconate dehydrogenase n=1 Tax=Ohtaekwangia koreensis TaxID=688867 RepID=A0A1T5K006_9BACT|nr:NAD(P)-binding domain-containing protein [Ohtaekwangia koreensis]SKC56865.1 6-phosphogluconate dehydrogenase [Ohtaekwangia koreensis]